MKKVKIVAVVAAILVGIGMFQFLNELKKPVQTLKTTVIMAACDIPENTIITEDMVYKKEIDKDYKHVDAETVMDNIIGFASATTIYKDEQILTSRIVPVGSDNRITELSYKVKTGMRAISINVKASSGVANMLRAGDHIDIILDFYHKSDKNKTDTSEIPASKISLQNVLVLAIDDIITKDKPEESYATITLEVTPEQAVFVAYGDFSSTLHIVLRSPLDEETIDPFEVNKDTVRSLVESLGESK